MEVINYLAANGVEKLREEFGIIVKEYFGEMLVLNYDQIKSPKTHPIVRECRGLILDSQYNIVSRGFERFFNLGEAPDTQAHLDFSKAVIFQKVDGSLIKIYNFDGTWYASTRGTAFAESEVNGFGVTFYELVLKALGLENDVEFQHICDLWLDPSWTYIFEVTSAENRVVRQYHGYTLWYLAARHNQLGVYGDEFEESRAELIGAAIPSRYNFKDADEALKSAEKLKNLDEGYVVYQDGVPVCKIKSPAYVAVHHIRGEGLTPKRIRELVVINEHEEYLQYFQEDRHFFEPYVLKFKEMLNRIAYAWEWNKGIECQKGFAMVVKDLPFSEVLFQARKRDMNPVAVYHSMDVSKRARLLEKTMEVYNA